ncbi:MarR family winged helix-turn-helix transcriptional regulator [Paraburkholderia sacchari]|uniref:MarR family winged helix-turn-helix transcriptional regulator n=1 Tax=Paraburkholderia sacchari TaxID=159450 RepID=UPI001FD09BF8|nr:MarR family winged helix-turn-helix transcriptional regulator [Paraburkholderia sacchari]
MHTQANPIHRATNREQPHAQFPEHDDCFAVRQAARHLSQLYERHLSAAGLTPTQFSILGALGSQGANGVGTDRLGTLTPSLTMAQLARTMVMERTTLLRALRPLLRSALVTDTAGVTGCRRRCLALTPAGRARLGEARVHWRAAQDEFERRFGPRRAAWLRRELLRITRAV